MCGPSRTCIASRATGKIDIDQLIHAHNHCTAERPVKQTTDHQALPISQLRRRIFQSRRVMPPKAPCRR